MKIVFIAQYLGDIRDPESFNSRFLYLSKMLEDANDVNIITSDFLHGPKIHVSNINYYGKCKITLLHEIGYSRNISIKRIISHHQLSVKLRKHLLTIEKPDVIYCAVPSLDMANEAAKYARKNNVRFIIDIQDLWPEAFLMVFHSPIISSLLFMPMIQKSNKVYAEADLVVAVSQTYAGRAMSVNKKCKQSVVAFLGTDLAKFDVSKIGMKVLEKPDGEVWMAYTGSLSNSYNLTGIMDSMSSLQIEEKIPNLRFIVMGRGAQRDNLVQYAKQKSLPVTFTGLLLYPQMVALLSICDFAVNPIRSGSAASIINKVGDYAAAGLPVINTQENAEYRELIDKYHAGINCRCDNQNDVADAIAFLANHKTERKIMGEGNRRLAEELFDRGVTYKKICEMIVK